MAVAKPCASIDGMVRVDNSRTSNRVEILSESQSRSWLTKKIIEKRARVLLVGEKHYDDLARSENYNLILHSLTVAYPNRDRILFLEYPGSSKRVTDLEKVVNEYLQGNVSYMRVKEVFNLPVYNKIPPTKKLLDTAAALGFRAKCVDQIGQRNGDLHGYMVNQIMASLGETSAVGVYIVGRAHITDRSYSVNTIPALFEAAELPFISVASFEKNGILNSDATNIFLKQISNGKESVIGYLPKANQVINTRSTTPEYATDFDLILVYDKP